MAIATIENFFNGPRTEETLEPVVLLPFGEYTNGTYDISSSGYKWSDFEQIDFYSKRVGGNRVYGSHVLSGYIIDQNPTSWQTTIGFNDAGSNYNLTIDATSDTEITVSAPLPGIILLGGIVGYRRRFSATSMADIITELLTQNGYAPRTETVLYDGAWQSTAVTLSDNLENYDELYVVSGYFDTANDVDHVSNVKVEDIVGGVSPYVELFWAVAAASSSNNARVRITTATSSGTTLSLDTVQSGFLARGVRKVIGIKYGV